MYIVFVGKPTFMMILNQMMDILWQTAVIVASGITRSAHTFKLKIFEMRSTTCNGTALLTENKLHEFRPQTFFFVFVASPAGCYLYG